MRIKSLRASDVKRSRKRIVGASLSIRANLRPRRCEKGHNKMSRKIWHCPKRASFLHVCARAIDLSPGITGSLSHLWNSFKTRFGTSVLPIASASITNALVPRTDTSAAEFTAPANFPPALLPQTEHHEHSDMQRHESHISKTLSHFIYI